jgi:phospholipase C
MFENRSLDKLLGRLYQPGEVASFAGVPGRDLSNPVPEWAAGSASHKVVPYGVAADFNSPSPDPGERYQHVNTQLFGLIDPPGNRGILAGKMTAPYNAPADPRQPPAMDGFVADYISAFTAETGRAPVFEEYAQIMTGYTPGQVPVVSALGRGFAAFDHWFCEVPSMSTAARMTMSRRPRSCRPARPRRPASWASLSTGRACACRPSPFPPGYQNGP